MILGTLIEKMAGMKITFSDYPRNAAFLLELREQVNKKMRNAHGKNVYVYGLIIFSVQYAT